MAPNTTATRAKTNSTTPTFFIDTLLWVFVWVLRQIAVRFEVFLTETICFSSLFCFSFDSLIEEFPVPPLLVLTIEILRSHWRSVESFSVSR